MAQSKAPTRSALCIVCLPLFCLAQQNKLVVGPTEPLNVKSGGVAIQTLKVTVLPGFHVNSDKPKDEFLIPLKLTWASGVLEPKSITYPKPEEVKVGADMLAVFTGTFTIQTQFKAPEQARRGSATLNGKLRYQACNNEMCFRPATIDVSIPVSIE